MRFVAVKSSEMQASAIVFRTRDLMVRQRTQAINALRGYLGEFGVIVAKGAAHVRRLMAVVEESDSILPDSARIVLSMLVDELRALDKRVLQLDREIAQRARKDAVTRRLITIPGIGSVTASALAALAPPAETFRRGRDFAAWIGLTPLQRSTGGKQKLGATSKRGERTLRRLLIIGASAVVRHAAMRGSTPGYWLASMLSRKPRMLVTVALANKMARIVWALLNNGGVYKAPAAPVALAA
jgi:transposase